ncbi:hypothetical protein HPB48_005110 [Haemaphysalis longicornis]|uniref:Uncharacterized protein n=1 Tax=Haemaphysalis longicornis TaxID=44386 RepID=A0A9J6FH99_HAELO|nr:hypothetical protein HPB48_005110 [Haemaphysalis longicornis]
MMTGTSSGPQVSHKRAISGPLKGADISPRGFIVDLLRDVSAPEQPASKRSPATARLPTWPPYARGAALLTWRVVVVVACCRHVRRVWCVIRPEVAAVGRCVSEPRLFCARWDRRCLGAGCSRAPGLLASLALRLPARSHTSRRRRSRRFS